MAIWTLALAGTANSNTVDVLGPGDPAAHAADYATYIVSFPSTTGASGWQVLPDPIVDDASVKITAMVLVNGVAARITTSVTGFGMSRIEWIKGGSYFQVLCPHGATARDGMTGISESDLEILANSVK